MRVSTGSLRLRLLATALALLMAMSMLPLAGMAQPAYAEPLDAEGEAAVAAAAEPAAEPGDGASPEAAVQDDEATPEAVPPDDVATPEAVPQDDGVPSAFLPLVATNSYPLTSGITGGTGAGTIALSAASAAAGSVVTVTATPGAGTYLAQVRYSSDGGLTYTAVKAQSGSYRFTMPAAAVDVKGDFVSKVWDGTIDVTWFDPDASVYTLYYPAQYAGLATIVNGLFTLYPTTPKLDENGEPVVDSRGPVRLPSYTGFRQGMGIKEPVPAAPEGTILPSRLYGEFTETYRLNDSQNSFERTAPITKTARVIGEPAYLVATCSAGTVGENNKVTTTDYWKGSYDFRDKTVYIGADLDFGGVQSGGVWSTQSPLFMPVAGQFSILPGSGDYTNGYSKLSSSWSGTLDGLGHRFTNVYCEYYANTEYGDSATIGLVGRMGVHDDDPAASRPVNPTVRQIVLESGYISGRRSTGGIVGKIGKTSKANADGSVGGIIEFCINKATVTGTDAKGAGGIVAAGWNGGVVRYCANFGRIKYNYSDPAGGIVGYNEIPVYNCYNVGLVTAGADRFAMGIGTNNGGGGPIVNCYWLTGKSAGGGYYGGSSLTDTVYEFGQGTSIPALTAARLNGGSGAPAIWYDDSTGINAFDGVNYPRLYFQTASFDPDASYTVTVSQPASGGTLAASATSGRIASTVVLSATATPGYVLDYYTVNGARISADNFALMGNVTVSAVFRQLKRAPLAIEDTAAKPYTLSVRRTGLQEGGSGFASVTNQPISSGATVYEGNTLTITATLKAGAKPDDASLVYSGQFVGAIRFGETLFSWGTAPFLVDAAHFATVGSEGGTVRVSATPVTVAKDWGQVANVSWFDADSPQASYSIGTAAQLAGVAKLVNDGTTAFEGVTLTLTNNISLANADGTAGTRLWVPIGATASKPFKGRFEGGGHVVSAMSVVKASGMYAALFGSINGATVNGLTVAGSVTGYQYSAGIVGSAKASTVSSCTNRATIRAAQNYVGGVVALASASTVTGCTNEGTIEPTTSSAAPQHVGGIVGRAEASSTVSSCTNTAAVTGGYDIGGVTGSLAGSTVTGSSNTAAVVATTSITTGGAGGIVGAALTSAVIAKSFNSGPVSSTGSVNASLIGGIVGHMTSSTIENSYNRGAVTTASGSAGGIVGRITATLNSPAAIRNAYTTGTVSKGIIGNIGAVAGYVNSPYNSYGNVHYLTGVAGASTTTNGYTNNVGSSSIAASAQSASSLKALAPTLGAAFKADAQSLNGGYPALLWQQAAAPSVGAPGSGDLDGDGSVSAAESSAIMRAVLGQTTLTPAQKDALDMDRDGVLTAADMLLHIKKILGLP
jgi:hypothetical protein